MRAGNCEEGGSAGGEAGPALAGARPRARGAWSAATGTLWPGIVLLPVVSVLQALGLAGVCWIVACVGVLVPDTTYVINLVATLLMFVSPIAFKPEMVPPRLQIVVWLNPVVW